MRGGEWLPATEALRQAGLEPITLAAKEGLALLNGTQASTAFALRGLFEAEDLFASAVVCGALTTEAALDRVVHLIRVFMKRAASGDRLTPRRSIATY